MEGRDRSGGCQRTFCTFYTNINIINVNNINNLTNNFILIHANSIVGNSLYISETRIEYN